MYSSSRTWVSPKVKENSQRQSLNYARRKVCRFSPFWSENFDLEKHKKEWEEGRKRQAEAEKTVRAEEIRRLQDGRMPISKQLGEAFAGKDFETNHSNVLSYETIWCPQWEKGKENIADWPPKAESKYEGDDRISTDKLHRRYPGAPRVEGNDTVNWQHRAIIEQFPFDDFYYPIPNAVEIFLKTHWVDELEFKDEEGEEAIGKELMEALDSKDQW